VRYLGLAVLGVALLVLLAVVIVGQPMQYDWTNGPAPAPSCVVAPRCTFTLLTTPALAPLPTPTQVQ
jgi:hypothetical protein